MKWKNKNYFIIKQALTIIVGACLMAVSVNMIFEPMRLVTGGVSGLGIVVKHLTGTLIKGGFPIWLFNLLCDIPLFFLSIRFRGKKFFFSAIFGSAVYTLALMLIPIYDLKIDDYLLASIMGGAISGIGIGMVFSAQASTGGTDLLANVIHASKKHLSIPQILNFVDGFVILIGALVFGLGNAMYALIAVYITSKVSDSILEGLKFAKMAYIISDHYTEIADAIIHQIDRGVTGINATGMYSNNEKKMLFCVVSKKEIVKIIEISQKIDAKSFVIISDVREVMGEGFIEYRQ